MIQRESYEKERRKFMVRCYVRKKYRIGQKNRF